MPFTAWGLRPWWFPPAYGGVPACRLGLMLHGHVSVVLKPGIFYQDNSLIQLSVIAANWFLPYPQGQEDFGGLVPVGRLALPLPAKSGYWIR